MTVHHVDDPDNTAPAQPEECPTCGQRWATQCRCMCRQRTCPNGHRWGNPTIGGGHR